MSVRPDHRQDRRCPPGLETYEDRFLLSGAGTPLTGRLLMLDGRAMEWSDMRVPRNPTCSVCGQRHG